MIYLVVCGVVLCGVSFSVVGKIGIDYLDLASIISIRVLIIVKSTLMALISSIIYTSIVLLFA